MPIEVPLAGWAGRELARLAVATGSAALAGMTGADLLGERARLNGFRVPGLVSAGGGCRMLRARDGWVALNLSRADDRDMLPALFGEAMDGGDDEAIAAHVLACEAAAIVARGREMGLALAAVDEGTVSPALEILSTRPGIAGKGAPKILDLSALWAGPLAARLLALAGARVVKIESPSRPDAMRTGDPALFERLNGGKEQRQIDLRSSQGCDALLALIDRADIVIEAARPRALLQLGIDADALVRARPGLVWLGITGHGVQGEAANWVGFGDDASVAGGLSRALHDATGHVGFAGDAVADPLTGITAARIGWERWQSGAGGRVILSMSGVARAALAEETARDPAAMAACWRGWAAGVGQPWPC